MSIPGALMAEWSFLGDDTGASPNIWEVCFGASSELASTTSAVAENTGDSSLEVPGLLWRASLFSCTDLSKSLLPETVCHRNQSHEISAQLSQGGGFQGEYRPAILGRWSGRKLPSFVDTLNQKTAKLTPMLNAETLIMFQMCSLNDSSSLYWLWTCLCLCMYHVFSRFIQLAGTEWMGIW